MPDSSIRDYLQRQPDFRYSLGDEKYPFYGIVTEGNIVEDMSDF